MKREYVLTYEDGHTQTVLAEDATVAKQVLRSYDVIRVDKQMGWLVERVLFQPPVRVVVKTTGEDVT